MRIIIIILIFTITAVGQNLKFTAKIGYDFGAEHVVDTNYEIGVIDEKIENTYSAAIEGTCTLGKIFDLGAGVTYRPKRNGVSKGNLDLTLIPVYSIVKINLLTVPSVNPQLIGHIGYSIFSTSESYQNGRDAEGGTYFALGAGLNPVSDLYTELLFCASNFFYNTPGVSSANQHKLQYTNVSLYVGWSF